MDYTLGGQLPNVVDTSYNMPVYSDTVTNDIATQGQAVESAGINDQWSSWFQNVAGNVLSYSLAKDAVQTKAAVTQASAQPRTVYATQQAAGGISANVLLLAGAAVLAVMLLKK